MGTLDTIIVVVVIAVGLIIMYRGLKEPLDMLFGLIARGFKNLFSKLSSGGGESYDVIKYG